MARHQTRHKRKPNRSRSPKYMRRSATPEGYARVATADRVSVKWNELEQRMRNIEGRLHLIKPSKCRPQLRQLSWRVETAEDRLVRTLLEQELKDMDPEYQVKRISRIEEQADEGSSEPKVAEELLSSTEILQDKSQAKTDRTPVVPPYRYVVETPREYSAVKPTKNYTLPQTTHKAARAWPPPNSHLHQPHSARQHSPSTRSPFQPRVQYNTLHSYRPNQTQPHFIQSRSTNFNISPAIQHNASRYLANSLYPSPQLSNSASVSIRSIPSSSQMSPLQQIPEKPARLQTPLQQQHHSRYQTQSRLQTPQPHQQSQPHLQPTRQHPHSQPQAQQQIQRRTYPPHCTSQPQPWQKQPTTQSNKYSLPTSSVTSTSHTQARTMDVATQTRVNELHAAWAANRNGGVEFWQGVDLGEWNSQWVPL